MICSFLFMGIFVKNKIFKSGGPISQALFTRGGGGEGGSKAYFPRELKN